MNISTPETAVQEPVLLTEAEYERLGNRYEIFDGQPVERVPMSVRAVIARDNLYDILKPVVKGWTIDKNYPGAPDLAVKVVSPENKPDEVVLKARRYLERGTEEVWVIYPEAEELHQYRKDQPDTLRVYRSGDRLEAATFFPGVVIEIATLFKLPELDS